MYLSIYRIETNENRRGCVIELTKFPQYLWIIKRHLIQTSKTNKTGQRPGINDCPYDKEICKPGHSHE